jgi:hypothetical protein
MSFLRTSQPVPTPTYTGLQLQTSSGAVPISMVYGATKIAPNVLWNGNFQAQYGGSGKGGAKGGGGGGGKGSGKGSSSAPSSYSCAIVLGLCEGPINSIGAVWDNASVSGLAAVASMSSPSYLTGTTPQSVWNYLSADFPTEALSYSGTAILIDYQISLGAGAALDSYAFEIYGRLYGSGFNGQDADPALVIQDFLTNAQYGVGFPAASIDAATLLGSSGDSSYQSYCKAVGLALSPGLTDQEAANSVLARWLQLTNTAAVWSSGVLKFIPYGDSSATGPLHEGGLVSYSVSGLDTYYSYESTPQVEVGTSSFTPDVTPIYNLTDDDYVYDSDQDPVKVERTDPYAAYNMQILEIYQRTNYYDATPITVWDQNAIELYGLRIASTVTAHEICDPAIAQTSAQLILQRGLYIRNHYQFKLSWEYCLLEPMDLVTLTDANLGLSNVAVRITEIEEDADGILAFTAEEFPGGVASAVAYPVQSQSSSGIAINVAPGPVNEPLIFEPSPTLTGGTAQIWAAVSGGIPSAYKLAEDGSTGLHECAMSMSSQPAGTSITFAVNVQAAGRSACVLEIYDGSASVPCVFDLSATTVTPGSGVTASSIIALGSGWYALSLSCLMAATGTPLLTVGLENPPGTSSYAGTSGDGIYFWDPTFAAANEVPGTLPAFTSPVGASVSLASINTPAGIAGTANPNWGGANIWASLDNVTYTEVGQIASPAKQGVLTAPLAAPAGANPDTLNTLSVSLAQSNGALTSTSAAGAQNATTLSRVDTEFLSFETATLSGPNAYNLTTLYRGLDDSLPQPHSVGASFTLLDDSIFKYDLPDSYIGQPLYLKFQSFNVFGGGAQDLSTCAVYTYTPVGSGAFGPVAEALAVGTNLDYRLASESVSESDDFGLSSDPYAALIDLGTVST